MLHSLNLNPSNQIHKQFAEKVIRQHYKYCKLSSDTYKRFEAIGFAEITAVDGTVSYGICVLISGFWHCKYAGYKQQEIHSVYKQLLQFLQEGNWNVYPQELKRLIQ